MNLGSVDSSFPAPLTIWLLHIALQMELRHMHKVTTHDLRKLCFALTSLIIRNPLKKISRYSTKLGRHHQQEILRLTPKWASQISWAQWQALISTWNSRLTMPLILRSALPQELFTSPSVNPLFFFFVFGQKSKSDSSNDSWNRLRIFA